MTLPSSHPASVPAAFRDTALTVATLGEQYVPRSFDVFRRRCLDQIQRLRDEWKAAGHPYDVIQDAVYAQCALLDEAALSHLADRDRDAWEREPLQVAEFGTHDAGETLIDRMQQRLSEPQPVLPLLAIFHAALSLGFRGRFALEGPDARAVMIRALHERLGDEASVSAGVVVRSSMRGNGIASISLPAGAMLAIVLAGMAWLLLDRWLGATAAQLLF